MEREMLSLVPTGRSDEKDACGCTPSASSRDDGTGGSAAGQCDAGSATPASTASNAAARSVSS